MIKTITISPLQNSGHMSDAEIRDEQQIVQKAKQDANAFGALYDRYFEGIFHFIYRRTDDEAVAGDLTSLTFLKALQNLKRYEFRGLPFSAWLFRIAANEVNKFLLCPQKEKGLQLRGRASKANHGTGFARVQPGANRYAYWGIERTAYRDHGSPLNCDSLKEKSFKENFLYSEYRRKWCKNAPLQSGRKTAQAV